jgi:hypothetical protein
MMIFHHHHTAPERKRERPGYRIPKFVQNAGGENGQRPKMSSTYRCFEGA